MAIDSLPRREREIFEIICRLNEGSAAAIRVAMTDPPSDSAVRALLARLVAKGLIAHRTKGQTYLYSAATRVDRVATSALRRMVQTFFRGSTASAATALLGMESKLTLDEIDALQRVIDRAREKAR